MRFHAETLKGHGLYVTMHNEQDRVVASTVVKGNFTERNLARLSWNQKGLSFARSAFQTAMSFGRPAATR